MLVVAAASLLAAVVDGQLHWKVALLMAATAWAFWMAGSRVLLQYDVSNGRSLGGDLALTVLLLLAVFVPMALLRHVSSHYAAGSDIARFLALLVPAVLCIRLAVVGTRLWRKRPVDCVLVVGAGVLGRLTQRTISDGRQRREVVGHLRFDGEDADKRLRAPVLGLAGEIDEVLRGRVVHEVYVASTDPHHREQVQRVVGWCETFGVPFALPLGGYRFARATPAREDTAPDGYIHYLSVRNKPLQLFLKLLIDAAIAGVALVLLSPLLVVVAVAIKLTSKGPLFFRQERVGLHGRTFYMLKFRSMVADAEALKAALASRNERTGPAFKIARDPRITPLGRYLRKFSIDELPQLLNVLRGDMSLVGPRPALPAEVAQYEGWQRRRLSVRPGLTCVWQVSGRDKLSFSTWMLLDMRYIDHWSLWADLRLILLTVPVVLLGRGAS
ncbi:MAG TPA: exopolysaccharide biosynthesis polyprenyl glycosylphosphotransferase [Polyangiaceae bacterium]